MLYYIVIGIIWAIIEHFISEYAEDVEYTSKSPQIKAFALALIAVFWPALVLWRIFNIFLVLVK